MIDFSIGVLMNLFNLIPGNFFSPLSSRNRAVYFDALMLLNEFVRQELNIKTEDYIASLINLIEDQTFIAEKEDETNDMPEAVEGEGGLAPNVKARLILNRLVNAGWVDRETMDGSFIEILTPRDYAIRMLQVLDELRDDRTKEYNSLVFSTYSALKQAENGQARELYEAVLSARRNTEHLNYELKSLYHNIRAYIKRIQTQNSVNELLENHFEKYKPMTDRIYHPIKTMDSIHRYKTPVMQLLTKLRGDDELLALMRERAVAVRKYEREEEAGAEILDAIDYVQEVYGGLGGTVDEIDRKHSAYTKDSIEKMTYMMKADHSIHGKLLDIFKTYAAGGKVKEKLFKAMRKEVAINRQEFIDGGSLYHKNILSRRTSGESLAIAADAALSLEAMQDIARQLRNVYSPARIRAFVDGLFPQGADTVESSRLALGGDSDFILLILAVARSKEPGMNYEVVIEDGQVEINGYRVPRMRFSRRLVEKPPGVG
jgi:hypothetical protein